MTKHILTILISLVMVLSTGGPSYAFQSRCLAVWCNPGMEQFWPSLHPDVMVTAYSWEQFDDFLRQTKIKAAGRPIDLEIDCHGSRSAVIAYEDYRTGKSVISGAGFGFICNHITKELGDQDVTVIYEGCFGGRSYHDSIRGNKGKTENFEGVPKFPIYGGSYNMYNLNNLVYMQYITGCRVWFEDLRTYNQSGGQAPIEDKNHPIYDKMMALYRMLGTLYQPDLPKPE